MIRNLRRAFHKRVDVDMLILGFLHQRLADVHVIELLGVHVEQVRIPLDILDIGDLLQVFQSRDFGVLLHGLGEAELIKVASSYHPRVSILGKYSLWLGQLCFEIALLY